MAEPIDGYSILEEVAEYGYRLPGNDPATHGGCVQRVPPEVAPHIQHQAPAAIWPLTALLEAVVPHLASPQPYDGTVLFARGRELLFHGRV